MKEKSNTDARRAFAARMRERRTELGITQEKLAELTGLHRTYVGSVERGERNVSIDNMERIAAALDMSLRDFFRDGIC
jgi:transcriptional regulator with XRE-family HTH domain